MSEELCRRLRELSASRHDDLSVGDEAATLIEQQAARIAELEAIHSAIIAEAAALEDRAKDARIAELTRQRDELLAACKLAVSAMGNIHAAKQIRATIALMEGK